MNESSDSLLIVNLFKDISCSVFLSKVVVPILLVLVVFLLELKQLLDLIVMDFDIFIINTRVVSFLFGHCCLLGVLEAHECKVLRRTILSDLGANDSSVVLEEVPEDFLVPGARDSSNVEVALLSLLLPVYFVFQIDFLSAVFVQKFLDLHFGSARELVVI